MDDLDHTRRAQHTRWWVGGLSLTLTLSVPVAVGLGPVAVPPADVAAIAGHHLIGIPHKVTWTPAEDSIVWLLRIPRVLLGLAVGAGLAIAGVTLQALTRNLLAEPYLLGVTSGASTLAAASILFGIGTAFASLTFSAFAGALLAGIAVFLLARVGDLLTSTRLVLAGISVGYVLQALTSALIFASDDADATRSVLFWILGSLTQASLGSALVTGLAVTLTLLLLLTRARGLDAIAIGDTTAQTLGISPTHLRALCLIAIALCVGAVVAASGGIGFVGLVIPHVARICTGASHRRLLPVSALLGAIFLIWADVAARTLLSPQELPLGIVTALTGAPLLFMLIRRMDRTR